MKMLQFRIIFVKLVWRSLDINFAGIKIKEKKDKDKDKVI